MGALGFIGEITLDIILIIVIIQCVGIAFGTAPVVVNPGFTAAMTYVGQVGYAISPIFPIDQLVIIMSLVVVFEVAMLIVTLATWTAKRLGK